MHTDTAPANRTLDIRVEASDYAVEMATPHRATEAEAAADLARLPKSAKFRLCRVNCRGADGGAWRVMHYASAFTRYAANGANGGKNETGARRFRTLVRWAAKDGVTVEYRPTSEVCGPATLAELDARL